MEAKLQLKLSNIIAKQIKANEEHLNIHQKIRMLTNISIRKAQDEVDELWISFKAAEIAYKSAKKLAKINKIKYNAVLIKLNKMKRDKEHIDNKKWSILTKMSKLHEKRKSMENKIDDIKTNELMKYYNAEDKEERKKEKMSDKLWKRIKNLPQDVLYVIRDYYMTPREQNKLMSFKLKRTIFPKLVKETKLKVFSKLNYFLYHIATTPEILDTLTYEEAIIQIKELNIENKKSYADYSFNIKEPRLVKNKIQILLRNLIKYNPIAANKIMKLYLIFAQDKYVTQREDDGDAYFYERDLHYIHLPEKYRLLPQSYIDAVIM